MEPDWDLQAVVRGCCSAVSSSSATTTSTATTTNTTTAPTRPVEGYNQQKSTLYGEDNIGILTFFPDLQKQPPPQSFQISPFSFLGGLQDPPYNNQQPYHHYKQQQKQFQVKQESLGVSRCTTTHAQGTTKIKKRKNQIKKVCQVPAEGSSPDLWSWRKYGQKPIKGSPYPRGYYKCSTLKGCLARKQVERNRSDPGMLIITYTGEHSHPMPTQVNSLAGSTRNRTNTPENKPTPSSPISPVSSLLPVPEKMEEIERDDTDEDNNFDVSGFVDDEDTFDGLDELVDSAIGDIFSDHHVALDAAPPFPWLSNNIATTTTTAAGGS